MRKKEALAFFIIISLLVLQLPKTSSAWVFHEDSYPRYTIGEKPVIEYVEICIVKEDKYLCRNIGDFQNEELGIKCSYNLFGQKNSYAEDSDIGELNFNCVVEKEYDTVCPVSMKLGEWPERRITGENEREIVGEIEQSKAIGVVGEGRGIVFVRPDSYHFRIEDLNTGVTFRLCSNKVPPGQYSTGLIFVPISNEISKDELHDPIRDIENPHEAPEIMPESAFEDSLTKDQTSNKGEKRLEDHLRDYWIWGFGLIMFGAFLLIFQKARKDPEN